jgi:ubiquinone/menaquinone biosynthesis C-methylase UbiE
MNPSSPRNRSGSGEIARFVPNRILEEEVMDSEDEVEAYEGGVTATHLSRMDDTFVRAALRFADPSARLLDVGTGPASLPVKMALKRKDIALVGVDLSETMLATARKGIATRGLEKRVVLRQASARKLPFPDGSFDLVVSNSLLHHLPDPVPALDEMARVLAPGGSVFIRDLRRPSPARIDEQIRRHGRFYSGKMYELFANSVRAAFTVAEMKELALESRLAGCRVRAQFQTYLVMEGSPGV